MELKTEKKIEIKWPVDMLYQANAMWKEFLANNPDSSEYTSTKYVSKELPTKQAKKFFKEKTKATGMLTMFILICYIFINH